jgi:hypothetical protein
VASEATLPRRVAPGTLLRRVELNYGQFRLPVGVRQGLRQSVHCPKSTLIAVNGLDVPERTLGARFDVDHRLTYPRPACQESNPVTTNNPVRRIDIPIGSIEIDSHCLG